MTPEKQQLLFDNTARAIDGAEEFIKIKHAQNCYIADPAYGEGVSKAMGIDIDKVVTKGLCDWFRANPRFMVPKP